MRVSKARVFGREGSIPFPGTTLKTKEENNMRWLVFIAMMIMSSTALADVKICTDAEQPYRCGTSWDANIDFGYGSYGLARTRIGILKIREPLYFSLGMTATVYNKAPTDFGIQGEVIHLWTGLWTQLGLTTNVKGMPGLNVSAGWSLFGVEAQTILVKGDLSWSYFGKLRIPIGIIALL